ncbi:MAG TPA: hypothetical protein VMP68_18070 [Candidatus Eisenbacteria bacterium]|nr:hypothetical protein [Candidatus Eisenbacteria bacterium]
MDTEAFDMAVLLDQIIKLIEGRRLITRDEINYEIDVCLATLEAGRLIERFYVGNKLHFRIKKEINHDPTDTNVSAMP